MILAGPYVPAGATCSGAATPGAKALMSWFLGAYGARGGTNLGIYGCRPIAGTTVPSVHGDGRAADLGTPVGNSWSWSLADWMRLHSAELGVQCLIHRRKIWSCNHGPDWRSYTGQSAHEEHIHTELTPESGQTMTVATITAVATGEGEIMLIREKETGAIFTVDAARIWRRYIDKDELDQTWQNVPWKDVSSAEVVAGWWGQPTPAGGVVTAHTHLFSGETAAQ